MRNAIERHNNIIYLSMYFPLADHNKDETCIVCDFQRIKAKCQSGGPPVSPRSIVDQLKCKYNNNIIFCVKSLQPPIKNTAFVPGYHPGEQYDAAEFLSSVIERINDLFATSKRLGRQLWEVRCS